MKFSLLNLLFLVVIVALCTSHFVMFQQLLEARSEVDNVRRKYGHIKIDDEKMTYVSRIADNEEAENAYRIIVPAGSRYMLHLADAIWDGDGFLPDPTPTKSISLNGWRDGADVILSISTYWENNAPRIVVHTEADEFFNYIPSGWKSPQGPSEGSQLSTDPQKAFAIDETIHLISWKDSSTNRGIMIWLEPHSRWEAKNKARKATAPSDAPKPPSGAHRQMCLVPVAFTTRSVSEGRCSNPSLMLRAMNNPRQQNFNRPRSNPMLRVVVDSSCVELPLLYSKAST